MVRYHSLTAKSVGICHSFFVPANQAEFSHLLSRAGESQCPTHTTSPACPVSWATNAHIPRGPKADAQVQAFGPHNSKA